MYENTYIGTKMGENLKNYIDENKDKKMRFIEFEDDKPSILGVIICVCLYVCE
jgi:hypothetical protein